MKSRIYTGHVMHQRYAPAKHMLRYPHYFYAFDLDELPHLHKKIRGFGHNKGNLVSLYDRDYLKGSGTIKERLLTLLKDRPYCSSIKRIELVTSARYLGYVFNPVSFYYCYSSTNAVLCVVAEVNNTFKERHIYILDKQKKTVSKKITFQQSKEFHVSPFNNREGYYELTFSPLDEKALILVTLFRDNEKILTAVLTGSARELTSANLVKTIAAFPLSVLLTVARIYKEAAKLFFIRKLKYHKKPLPSSDMTISLAPPGIKERFACGVLTYFLKHFMLGRLAVTFPGGEVRIFGDGDKSLQADINIKSHAFFWKVFKYGDIGFGEAFMHGLWDSTDMIALLNLSIANIQKNNARKSFLTRLSRAVKRLRHPIPRNSLPGSKKNIEAHYDLGNDFFSTFLDKTMLYSSAIYNKKADTLEEAQKNKVHTIIEKAGISAAHSILEIGSGWGGFALEAVRQTGCHVTTTTISKQQYEYVTALIKKNRMQNNITVLFEDYRHLQGQYDRIVSIEMLEAIGLQYFGTFFRCCESLLKPQGMMAHQIIMIPDHRLKEYKNSHDWIRKHIFPGGALPSLSLITGAMEKYSTFHIHELIDIGPHYARTLFEWRKNFQSAGQKLLSMGYDEIFQRKWLYYLMTCEAAFINRIIYDAIIIFTRQFNQTIPLGPSLVNYDRISQKARKR